MKMFVVSFLVLWFVVYLKQSPFITISRRDKLVTWLGERIRMLCESKMDTERVFQIVKTAKEYQRRK